MLSVCLSGVLWRMVPGGEWLPRVVAIGGRWWRCLGCDRTIAADCECCEPPACGCARGAAA
jgi:hypothetical protein